MAVGGHNFGRYRLMHDDNWTRTVLERAGAAMDFLAVHNAYAPVLIRNEPFEEVYRGMLSFPEQVREDSSPA
jgi:alpha-N-arabinofuranosidase